MHNIVIHIDLYSASAVVHKVELKFNYNAGLLRTKKWNAIGDIV